MRGRVYQPISNLTSTCLETEVNYYLTSLGVTYGQQIKSPSCCWLSIPGLVLQITSYPHPNGDRTNAAPQSMSWKQYALNALNHMTTWMGYLTIIQIKLLIETKSHNLCLGKFYIIRSQEKNSNQNRDSNLRPPDF